jgi:Ca-activated chloride channel family protein
MATVETAIAAPNSRPRFWLCAGLALIVVALARPQWGKLDEPVFDQSREILLAIDLSRSMLTPDVKPSRLGRAKLLIQSLLEKLAGERVGLVVFSGTAFLQSPLSADYEILREFCRR